MRLIRTEYLISAGAFAASAEWPETLHELEEAIARVVWPPGAKDFAIYPESGKRRGQGNGVTPIKNACMHALEDAGWELERRLRIGTARAAGAVDAVREYDDGRLFMCEWETGNISSSHRSLNKMALGIIQEIVVGGCLILPTREMYQYLTDRIGNYREIEPYFPLWKHVVGNGVLVVMAVQHDREDRSVPRITKGTDGRALV